MRFLRGTFQAAGVVLAGIISLVLTIVYMHAFADELDENAPLNVNGGPWAPVYRHFLEAIVIQVTGFLTACAGYFWLCGPLLGLRFDWHKVRHILFWAHIASGAVILVGLTISIVQGQRIQVRDGTTALVGGFLLLLSVCDLLIPREQDSDIFDAEFRDRLG